MPRSILWGGWLVVTGVVFSLSQGIIHSYYTVALAPAIGAIVGIMATVLWRQRGRLFARAALAVAVAASALWARALLERTPSWHPALQTVVLVTGFGAALALLAGDRLRGVTAKAVVIGGLVAALAGPVAYSVATAATAHSGALPSAGPAGQVRSGPGGGAPGGGGPGGGFAGGPAGRTPPGGGFGGGPAGQTGGGQTGGGQTGGFGGGPSGQAGGAQRGGIGGLLNGSTPSPELVKLLQTDGDHYTWVAAAIGANQASGYQLGTGDPVMAIGGFNGTDPSPTLAQFQAYVSAGRIHYFIAGGGGGGSSSSTQITSWVTSTFQSTTVGGVTLYDLSSPG